jgi:hypothetical protein
MSFGINFIGEPLAIKRKLSEESERYSGQSKVELDAVIPALEILLDQQVANGVVQLVANGHATITDGVKTYGQCNVELKALGQLVEY